MCCASAPPRNRSDSGRPTVLRLALSAVPIGVERSCDYPTRHCHSMASDGLPAILAPEVALSWRSAKDIRGDPPPEPRDEPGKPVLTQNCVWPESRDADDRKQHFFF